MKFLIVLVCTIVFILIFKPLIKRYAVAFYGIALLLDILFVVGRFVTLPGVVNDLVFLSMQKCTLALAFFVVVMYIGIFPKGSKPRNYLMPIRKELSIIACLLTFGHMIMYLMSYAPRMMNNFLGMNISVVASLIISIILLILLVVLGVTSLDVVKKRMSAQGWKRLQRFAYLFFMLVYVHLLLLLLPPALQGGEAAQMSVGVYSVIFIVYAVARIAAGIIEYRSNDTETSFQPH